MASDDEIPDRIARKYGFASLRVGDSIEIEIGTEARSVAKMFAGWCRLNGKQMTARSERNKPRDNWRVVVEGSAVQ